ncbi:MAG: phage tail terminator-like protein [Casimicrobium sp.]
MSTSAIRKSFETILEAWALSQNIKVQFENQTFAPPKTLYLRCFLLPAETDSLDLDGEHRLYRGVFQVSVYAPIGAGSSQATAVAESVAALYPKETAITVGTNYAMLTKPMSIARSIQTEDRYVVPVSCAYQMTN